YVQDSTVIIKRIYSLIRHEIQSFTNASFFEVTPIEKLPSISKKVWWRAVKPTFSISFVRIAFCAFTIFGFSGITRPSKYFFSVATPELIHSRESSTIGTSGADRKSTRLNSSHDSIEY